MYTSFDLKALVATTAMLSFGLKLSVAFDKSLFKVVMRDVRCNILKSNFELVLFCCCNSFWISVWKWAWKRTMDWRLGNTLIPKTKCYRTFLNQTSTSEFAISPIGQVRYKFYKTFCEMIINRTLYKAKRQNNISRVAPEDIDPFLCTHINFAFAKGLYFMFQFGIIYS